MAELRLALHDAQPDQVNVDILKRRGGWPQHNITVALQTAVAPRRQAIEEQLTLWRTLQSDPNEACDQAPLPAHMPIAAATSRDNLQVH